ncbi:MAG TPA: PQQ-binding-like beta-propeller repeat protein [Cyclobacteriaceae bacterium]|nr:PQQ-binding-like beta-propeller repeat protein [Cyclobacteriaceae bacterium]
MNKFYYSLIVVGSSLLSCTGEHEPSLMFGGDWKYYQGDLGRNQYSVLDRINVSNVRRLEVAWTYHTGDLSPEGRTQIQCNPIIVGGVLYATTPKLDCFALDAATGKEIWRFRPEMGGKYNFGMGVNRGVTYFNDHHGQRIYYIAGHYLYALDAATGKLIQEFGDKGSVDIKRGLGKEPEKHYVNGTTPGVIYKDKIIVGCRVSEDQIAAPGYIQAFNVYSGNTDWVFHTVPQPGEFGSQTWPENTSDRIGGANNWSGMSLDEELGIVYVPTGSASFDFYGGNREGKNLFANCILALDAATGKRIWHYQTVHHDLWDRDLPAPPNLFTFKRDGKEILALAQIAKSGFIFVFNRATGEPLFPIDEVAVPGSNLRGEKTWPTQPVPRKPAFFSRQFITEIDFNDFDPEVKQKALETFRKIRQGRYYIPPSMEGTLIFPGFDGGGEWGGAAVDPETIIMYVNSNEMPWIHTMVDLLPGSEAELSSSGKILYQKHCMICHMPDRKGDGRAYPNITNMDQKYTREDLKKYISVGRGVMPAFGFLSESEKDEIATYILNPDAKPGTSKVSEEMDSLVRKVPYTHTGYVRWVDKNGDPVITPPWGALNAINLNSGEIVWRVPLGELDYLTERGIPPTGTENYGGPVVTAGGLIFIGATKDEKFRAFDKATGELLWETKLPYGGYATPAVYETGGKEYVVIACGGGKMGTASGDVYVAFSLP